MVVMDHLFIIRHSLPTQYTRSTGLGFILGSNKGFLKTYGLHMVMCYTYIFGKNTQADLGAIVISVIFGWMPLIIPASLKLLDITRSGNGSNFQPDSPWNYRKVWFITGHLATLIKTATGCKSNKQLQLWTVYIFKDGCVELTFRRHSKDGPDTCITYKIRRSSSECLEKSFKTHPSEVELYFTIVYMLNVWLLKVTRVSMPSGLLGPKDSVAPICGMLPGLPLWQEWPMPALPGGVCLTRAVGSASKQSSLKCRSRVYCRVITPPWWSCVMLRIISCSQPFSITLIMCFTGLLPPVRKSTYNLRQRPHDRTIPLTKNTKYFKKTFINRMALKDSY